MPRLFFMSFFLFLFFAPSYLLAQETVHDTQTAARAEVLRVIQSEEKIIPGTGTPGPSQSLEIKILEGKEEGKILTIENDYLNFAAGDVFYLVHTTNALDGTNMYYPADPYRLPALYFFAGLFVVCLLFFGGWQGVRGLVSLAISFLVIIFLLLPGIIHGYSPILLSISVSSFIIILGSYITHGFNKTTTAAVLGMVGTIIFTGILAHYAVSSARLTGFGSDESVYVNFNAQGSIDMAGLLLGGIMIGLLGVLYDIAIGQAISVEELHRAGTHLSRKHIYKRAIRIGREHIGALVNTLAIAYVGASLPLLLLMYTSAGAAANPLADMAMSVNREVFAAEIMRTLVGSIGLVLAVPITTLIAVFVLVRK
jgi:uncharacterized membrane protein